MKRFLLAVLIGAISGVGVAACATPPLVPAAVHVPAGAASTFVTPAITPTPLPRMTTVAKPPVTEATRAPTTRAAAKPDATTRKRAKKSTGRTFDPSNPAYQGYVDPGAAAGRAPTSGESQFQYACQQGWATQGC